MKPKAEDKPGRWDGWTGASLGLPETPIDEAIRKAVPDVAAFELRCALTPVPDPYVILSLTSLLAWIRALREARPMRRDLSRAEWEECVSLDYAGLHDYYQRQSPMVLLSTVALRQPPPPSRPRRGGLTVGRMVKELITWSAGFPPTQEELAEELGVTDRRLRQVARREGLNYRDVIEKALARRSA